MQYAAYRSGNRACALVAACIALTLAGCSSNVSRFDFPVFGSTASNDTNADYAATASLPPVVPEESVYSGGANPQFQRASLPPPSSPAPTQAAYSPPPGRVRDQHAKYPAPPHTEPAVWRGTSQVQGLRIKVQKGETLSSLSRRYGVSVEAIQAANNLPDGRLNIGQELVIPGASAKTAAAKPVAPKVTPEPEPAVPSLPSVAEEETSPAPGGTAVRVVKTTTILPPGSTSLAEEEEKEAGVAPAAKSAKPASTEEKAAASPEITGEGKQRLAKVEQLPAPDPMSGNSFRWPVKGRVISQFGARPDGGHNDGIDLAVPQGTPVQAAENGVVAYAGNELKGYGNLVLIRHSNNWVSAYAHNEEILVKRGDKVSRGQVIAKAGATGAVSQPLVHFELRKGSRPVDPTKYMSNQTAKAD
ncbi:MAG TPA: M23 family metallopeptidase [Methyloceanibacter sp.]|nr:M23 family metallopeptidase [Methyloceanibacter sp.]